jgi:hypothetical protein
MTMLAPFPTVTTGPGYLVRVQSPDGRPVNSTLPVARIHDGGVIFPTPGAEGIGGWLLTTALSDEGDVHPAELVTVKVYVPGSTFAIVVVVPLPVVVPPGVLVSTQSPDAGKPLMGILPTEVKQPGWVMVPITGAEGSVFTVTAMVLAVLVPQVLFAVTDNVPEVAEAE